MPSLTRGQPIGAIKTKSAKEIIEAKHSIQRQKALRIRPSGSSLTPTNFVQNIRIAREFNNKLLRASQNGVLTGKILAEINIPPALRSPLPPNIDPSTRAYVYPFSADQEKRIEAVPQLLMTATSTAKIFNAITPQIIQDTFKLANQPPKIRVINQSQPGDYYASTPKIYLHEIEFTVEDDEGLDSVGIGFENRQGEYIEGASCQLDCRGTITRDFNYTVQNFFPPGKFTCSIYAYSNDDQWTSETINVDIIDYAAPPTPQVPKSQYDYRTQKQALEWKISEEDTDKILKAADAVASGDWDVTFYGSVEVTLQPDKCKVIAGIASIVAAWGAKKFFEAMGGPAWLQAIWAMILAQAALVAGVLGACAAENRKGVLGWNALCGLFYAYKG